MMFVYWAIKREIAHRRRTREAMRDMRRRGYVAEWNKWVKRDWNRWN